MPAAKGLNMFLRWMVRKDKARSDFGIWKKYHPSQLIIPLDLHVARVARHFNLLQRKPTDWQAALELTNGYEKHWITMIRLNMILLYLLWACLKNFK